MTNVEFSNEFDVLYNNISSNQAPGLNEYEKSIFLTKAQNEILKNYFNPKGNKFQEGYDDNEKRQIDFSGLTSVKTISESAEPKFSDSTSQGAKSVQIPADVFLVINESIKVNSNKILQVIPIRYDEYVKVCSKPYKQPLKNQAWRLITGDNLNADIVCGHNNTFTSYTIRYIRKPHPIILEDLGELSIDSKNQPCGAGMEWDSSSPVECCELDSEIHPEILQRAVELAKSAYTGDINSITELGKRSE